MWELIVISFTLPLLYAAWSMIYNAFFHPLSKYPGPKIWGASRWGFISGFASGKLSHRINALHRQYGEVVRTGPNDLSIIDPKAWADVWSHRAGRRFKKDPEAYKLPPGQDTNIVFANDADHSRFRRLLSHAFSDKALREQQPLIKSYVDMLIQQLRKRAHTGESVNMVAWYNFTTFDIIGDLTFGESFECLATGNYHPWIKIIFGSIKAGGMFNLLTRFIPAKLLLGIIPKSWMKPQFDHNQMTLDKVNRRLEMENTRPDFFSYILRHKDERGMSHSEMMSNANILIIAGSETTATALSGTTYWLLRKPETMKLLTEEIRGRFKNIDDMTPNALADCQYLMAVLKEGIRMYPPVPGNGPRLATQEDSIVAGRLVPKGTKITIPQWAAFHSTLNFKDPDTFKPERWLNKDPEERHEIWEPFSTGPRNCLGQNLAWAELRLILARVVLSFDMELLGPDWDPEQQHVYGLWEKPSLNIRLTEVAASS